MYFRKVRYFSIITNLAGKKPSSKYMKALLGLPELVRLFLFRREVIMQKVTKKCQVKIDYGSTDCPCFCVRVASFNNSL